MTKYETLNVKLSNSLLHKLKLGIKNGTEVALNLVSNDSEANSDSEANFLHKLLLTYTQILRLHKAFLNNYQLIRNYRKLNCL